MSSSKKSNSDAVILDLTKIAEILNSKSSIKNEFLNNFKEWERQRRKTLHALEILEKEIKDIYFDANVAKWIGYGASAVGFLSTCIGICLSISKDPPIRMIGQNMIKWGTGGTAVGGGISAFSSAAENYTVKRKVVEDVKSTLVKDQQMTKALVPYLKNSEDLNSLFRQVFGCGILSKTAEDILIVIRGIGVLYKQGRYAYVEISNALSSNMNQCSRSTELKKIKIIFQRLSRKAQFVLKEFCENREVRSTVLEMKQAVERSGIELVRVCLRFKNLFGGDSKWFLMVSLSWANDIAELISRAKDLVNSDSKYDVLVENIRVLLSIELNKARNLVYRTNPKA